MLLRLMTLNVSCCIFDPVRRIVTASGLGFGDWQWRLATLPFAFGGLGVYFAGDVLNYAFLASRCLCNVKIEIDLLRHSGIVASGLPLKMPIRAQLAPGSLQGIFKKTLCRVL
ncbi:hypothetical protein Tco_0181568, partial [Tanacetum coccineum]